MKHPIRKLAALAFASAVTLATPVAPAQTVIYSDDFEADTSANYDVTSIDFGAASDFNVFFATNYTLTTFPRFGVNTAIPTAPGGAGGRGVKMFVNKNDATAATAAINIYPKITQPFTNDYALKVDMFLGYNGPVAGGTGSTEFGIFGVNHTGTQINWNAGQSQNVSDGAWFAVTGEGGATGDYRSIVGDGVGFEQRFTGAGGGFIDRDDSGLFDDEVFITAGGEDPALVPALWHMFPTNTVGETPGVPGKQWVQVEVRQRTNSLGEFMTIWLMNNYIIARHTNVTLVAGVTNAGTVMLGNMDNFASIASPAIDNYVIYDNLKVVDLQGVPDLPEVSIVASDDSATEGGDSGVFTVSRTGSAAGSLTVNYVVRGTAVSGGDFTALPGSVTFQPGDSTTNIVLTPVNDGNGETTETVVLVLRTASNYEVYDSWAKVNLLDDGDLPVATLSTFRFACYEGNTNSYGLFRVIFSNPTISDVTVNYSLSGSAVNGTHYETLSGSTTITTGTTTNELYILPINNADAVSNRTVTVTLTTGSGYDLGGVISGTATIFNDDLPAATGTLYSDNFDTDTSAGWSVFASTNNCAAEFAYDYGANLGIPSAPRSTGGSTMGLRLRANSPLLGQPTTTAQFPGITTSPTGQSFSGDYRIRFDAWLNFPGGFPGGGAGSTQLGSFGVTSGTKVQWSGFSTSSPDAVFFGMTGDGGSGQDWRIYTNIVRVGNVQPGVYAAGTGGAGNEAEPYYGVYGRMMAPASQSLLFPSQTGITAPGSAGMVWRDVVITKLGSTVIWLVDGVKIGTVNSAKYGVNLSTNLFLGVADVNGTQTTSLLDATLCAVYDNLVVESLPAPTQPGITSIVITGGNVQIDFTNSVSDIPDLFTVRAAATVSGAYTYQAATITELAPGAFRAVTPYTATSQRYYRILR